MLSGNSRASAKAPNSFLDLALETRQQIYEYVLVGHVIVNEPPWYETDPPPLAGGLGLHRTNWQLYEETRPYVYHTVHLGDDPARARKFLETIGGRAIRCIQNLGIHYNHLKAWESAAGEGEEPAAVLDTRPAELWAPVFDLLRWEAAAPRVVQVYFYCETHWDDSYNYRKVYGCDCQLDNPLIAELGIFGAAEYLLVGTSGNPAGRAHLVKEWGLKKRKWRDWQDWRDGRDLWDRQYQPIYRYQWLVNPRWRQERAWLREVQRAIEEHDAEEGEMEGGPWSAWWTLEEWLEHRRLRMGEVEEEPDEGATDEEVEEEDVEEEVEEEGPAQWVWGEGEWLQTYILLEVTRYRRATGTGR